ncbi:hypothetical protein EDB87DRAFT_1574664 [Lactarius vividus]|nr:hypothetical protein EDB87DRAFT_1574664 [Lactarius vividus]
MPGFISNVGDQDDQEEGSGTHNVDIHGNSGHSQEDTMEHELEQESDDNNNDGNGNGNNDGNSDGDGDDKEKELAPPSSLTWYPYVSLSPHLSPHPTPDPSTVHQAVHLHGLNAPMITSTFKSTTTTLSTKSPTQAQVQALESNTLQDMLPVIPTLVPLSPCQGPLNHSLSCTIPELPVAVSTQGWWLRKVNVLSLNMYSEISAGVNVMKCQVPGCETVWLCGWYELMVSSVDYIM